MTTRPIRTRLAMAGVVVALVIAACTQAPAASGPGSTGGTAAGPKLTIAMITHETPGDTYWDIIRAEHPSHPYASLAWPIGQGIGYGETFVNQAVDLVRDWSSGSWTPSFADGLAVQAVCDAMERSAAERRWVSVAEITNAPEEPPRIAIESSRQAGGGHA